VVLAPLTAVHLTCMVAHTWLAEHHTSDRHGDRPACNYCWSAASARAALRQHRL